MPTPTPKPRARRRPVELPPELDDLPEAHRAALATILAEARAWVEARRLAPEALAALERADLVEVWEPKGRPGLRLATLTPWGLARTGFAVRDRPDVVEVEVEREVDARVGRRKRRARLVRKRVKRRVLNPKFVDPGEAAALDAGPNPMDRSERPRGEPVTAAAWALAALPSEDLSPLDALIAAEQAVLDEASGQLQKLDDQGEPMTLLGGHPVMLDTRAIRKAVDAACKAYNARPRVATVPAVAGKPARRRGKPARTPRTPAVPPGAGAATPGPFRALDALRAARGAEGARGRAG